MKNRAFLTMNISWSCLAYVFACSSETEHLACIGSNATLEWTVGNESSELKEIDVRIRNPTGNIIISTDYDRCISQDTLSQSCVFSENNDNLMISLTFINITPQHSGKYTAWIKNKLRIENRTKELIVIDRPQIRENGKPVLHKSFEVMCTTLYVSDCQTYYWKINGAVLNYRRLIHTNSSTLTFKNLTVMENFSTLACQVGIQNVSNDGSRWCSEYSLTYTLLPYYGPVKMFLTLNKSDIYLQENQTVKVKCLAECYPACTFRWESYYINVENEELIINSFNERFTGAYTCIATNRETGETSKFYPIFLHHERVSLIHEDKATKGLQLELLGMGLVIISVSLVIVGVLIFVTHRRKETSRRLSSSTIHQPCAVPSNREVRRDFLSFNKHDKPLPIPAVQENIRMMMRRSWNPNTNRISKSLQTGLDDDQDFLNPIRQSLSLQTLIQLSLTTGKRTKSDESLNQTCCSRKDSWLSMTGPAHGISLEYLYSKVDENKKISTDKQNTRSRSICLNNFRPQSFDLQPQEDLYSTIDEQTCYPVYDYTRANKDEGNPQETETEAGNYQYDYVTLPPF